MFYYCKNCAGQLVFDPGTQRMLCAHCGADFSTIEVGVSDSDPIVNNRPESFNEINGIDSKEFMDCYVYTCSSCGGEIIINGSEASTKCIYCGNSSVVFSRISRHKRPHGIIPFKISQDDAVELISERFKKGIFVPKDLKNFKANNVRGIYIPYWIINCRDYGYVTVKGQVKQGKHTYTKYYGRAGKMLLKNIPLDASQLLSDESSSRLEPYDFTQIREFNEDFILGFYSNISDVNYADLRYAAMNRSREYFEQAVLQNIPKKASSKKIYDSHHAVAIDYEGMTYAMLPAWFVTYEYKGKHNTIIVNGQTGKIVCGIPWNQGLFYSLLFISGILLSVVSYQLLSPMASLLFSTGKSSSSSDSIVYLTSFILAGAIAMFSIGIRKLVKTVKSIKLTQSQSIFNFVKKRQG